MTALMHKERATVEAIAALGVAIKALGSVPSGHLTLEQYTSLIDALKHAGLVSETHHELTWVGVK